MTGHVSDRVSGRHLAVKLGAFGLLFTLAACAAGGSGGGSGPSGDFATGSVTRPDGPSVQVADPDEFLVVDCELPAQVRRLGSKLTYLGVRRAVRTSGLDCAIRGGEYVAYDRADYRTALAVWMEPAKAGDPQAMNYVGEILERGLGTAPDYVQAASWYQRAAEQGFSPAQINLGQLYEQGLGVEKDPVIALNWYRRASSLDQAGLAYVASADTAAENEKLQAEVGRQSGEAERLREELRSLQGRIAELQRQQPAAAPTPVAAVSAAAVDPAELERLEDARAQIASERTRLEQERARATAAAQELERLEDARAQMASERTRLEQERSRATSAAQELERSKAALEGERQLLKAEDQKLQARLEASQAAAAASSAAATEASQSQAELDRLQADLRERQQALAERERELAARSEGVFAREREISERAAELEAEAEALEQARAEVGTMSGSVQDKRAELSSIDQEIADLRRVFEEQRTRLESLNSEQQIALAGPSISLVDPPLPEVVTRGTPVVRTRSGVATRQIIGRVEAPAGVLSLVINDVVTPLEDRNLFRAEVPVSAQGTKVLVAAIDRQGKRADLEFLLEPAAEALGAPETTPAVAPVVIPDLNLGNYHALVIGNNAYQKLQPLRSALNDANAVADILAKKYGFKVTLLENANRYQILSALNELRNQLTENDNLLIYYAGHGEFDRDNQRGHWLPIDAEPDSTANWISNIQVTDILNSMSAKRVLVVADSCYSGALTRAALAKLDSGTTNEARVAWLKAMAAKRSRTALTSGGLAPTLDGGGGDHSVFAKAFLEVLEQNDALIEGQRVFQEISARVTYAASRFRFEQLPQYAPIKFAGHESGEFFFRPQV